MKRESSLVLFLAVFLTIALALPAELLAAPDAQGQRAGQVDRLIPAVGIARGAQAIKAAAKTPVFWQDVVNTQAGARVRIALDDGSVLNVGSESSLHVVKHDGGAQQTELELTYGKLRSQAAKIVKADGKFEVHTAAGVAGVVGTDFYTGFENNLMTVIVYENIVRVCNLVGVCVDVLAGQFTTVRQGDNSPPLPPAPATPQILLDARNNTSFPNGPAPGVFQGASHFGKGAGIAIGILAIIPAVVIPLVVRSGNNAAPPKGNCPPATGQCP
jgi:ferric-dicitrate binding protein FerR (iron transport regulator)